MSLRDRLIKCSTIELTSTLADSDIFTKKDMIATRVPMINVALSGDVNGGLSAGVTMIAGPSKHFKTAFALLMAKSYLDKYDDAVILLYDSEFGSPQAYFKSFDIDLTRVIHTPITDFEELRHDISVQLGNINRNDHIMILVDSIGNLPSRKEVQDAIDKDASPADFTRAKVNKSFFRIVTPKLNLKNIPMVVINHTYKTMEMFSRDVVGGGCVVAGTKIKMADNSLKSMEDISINDTVITTDGPKTVTAIWNPETLLDGMPECYEVEFEDGYKVIVSENHKFLADSGRWVKVTDSRPYDQNFLSVP